VQEQGGFNFADGEIDEALLQEEGECASEAGSTEEEGAAAASQHEDGDATQEILPQTQDFSGTALGTQGQEAAATQPADDEATQEAPLGTQEWSQAAAGDAEAAGIEEDAPGKGGATVGDLDPDGPMVVHLVDADNGFNNQSRLAMLWTVRHRWPVAARFAMNLYRHQVRMVVRDPGKEPHIILAKEGVVQGDPLAMFLYAIGLLPLVVKLR